MADCLGLVYVGKGNYLLPHARKSTPMSIQ